MEIIDFDAAKERQKSEQPCDSGNRLYTVREFCDEFQISLTSFQLMCEDGEAPPTYQIWGSLYIRQDDVNEWVRTLPVETTHWLKDAYIRFVESGEEPEARPTLPPLPPHVEWLKSYMRQRPDAENE